MSIAWKVLGLSAAFSLLSCAGNREPTGSDALARGHVDGCVAGYSDAYRFSYAEVSPVIWRNEQQYLSSPDYRTGWDAGYRKCYEQERSSPVMGGG